MNAPVYNCGCFTWMHGTGEDACDLYLPERRPARKECPMWAYYRGILEARRAKFLAASAAIPDTYIPVYGLRRDPNTIGAALGMMNAAQDNARNHALSLQMAQASQNRQGGLLDSLGSTALLLFGSGRR